MIAVRGAEAILCLILLQGPRFQISTGSRRGHDKDDSSRLNIEGSAAKLCIKTVPEVKSKLWKRLKFSRLWRSPRQVCDLVHTGRLHVPRPCADTDAKGLVLG